MSTEFQAVLLAGGDGNRLYPLSEELAPALLPVANRPLISYQIEFLENIGIRDVLVVTREDCLTEVTQYVTEVQHSCLNITFVPVAKDVEGTAHVLRQVQQHITTDFLVISGDIIVEPPVFFELADIHRRNDALVTTLFKVLPPEEKPKKTLGDEKDVIMVEQSSGRLLYLVNGADVEPDAGVSFPRQLLRRFPSVSVRSDVSDQHCYLFKRKVLEFLDQVDTRTDVTSIRNDLIPLLVRSQFYRLPEHLAVEGLPHQQASACAMSTTVGVPSEPFRCYVYLLHAADSGPHTHTHTSKRAASESESEIGSYCGRATDIQSFARLSHDVAGGRCGRYKPFEAENHSGNKRVTIVNYRGEGSTIAEKTVVGGECVVGQSTSIGTRVSVKRTIIGPHCRIDNNVRINNCIIMHHVTIEAGANLSGAIVCPYSTIGEKASLTNVQVGLKFKVPANSEYKGRSLIRSTSTAE